MKIKKFLKNEKAVAGAIEFLLIIAFFAIILAYIQLNHVPNALEDKESAHMETVSNQLSRLKAFMDVQSEKKSSSPLYGILTLGSRELPYWFTAPSYGEIRIIDDEETSFNISVDDDSCKLSRIEFRFSNTEFVDQTYILEGGGLLVGQSDMNYTMMVDPNINAHYWNNTSGNDKIYFNFDLPIFKNINENDNIVGFGNCYIKTRYSDNDHDENLSFNFINITTKYPNAWYTFLDSAFSKKVREKLNITQYPDHVLLTKKNEDVDLVLQNYNRYELFVSIE